MIDLETIRKAFSLEPTDQQYRLFMELDRFLASRAGDECFVLTGYAGTGKTTSLGVLVKLLSKYSYKPILLAPTGRAAKVITNYSGAKAYTIHKRIYRKKSAVSPEMAFVLAENKAINTLFIVDEASMIADEVNDNSRSSLLHDLIDYVYNGNNCKLMLIGDTAQLPPVGSADSPALNPVILKETFALTVFKSELTEVMRQAKSSGILENATRIRNLVRTGKETFPQIVTKGFPDIYRMTGERLDEGLNYAYQKYGKENTLLICRSNKNANGYNQQIRNRILYREEELTGDDAIMVVRNNYFWLQEQDESSANFIANGDIARIKRVKNIHEMYGFRFADVRLEFLDYEGEPLDCKVMLDTLYTESPNLSYQDSKRFFDEVLKDYQHIANRQARMKELKLNPYFNALQIKFAYAVTCHKAQGGQWDAVFIDQGYLTEDMINMEFLRWFYTAFTRATKELFLVNFSGDFYENPEVD
ncbi:MAG: ATP-dependent DNA helicase [Sphingobacteriaceae bacterium]